MDLLSILKKYKIIIFLMAIGYVLVVSLYYFFGYGTIVIDQKAYVFVDNVAYGQNQRIRIRPGTYLVRAQTPVGVLNQTLRIYPFKTNAVSIKQSDYANIIKSLVPAGSSLNISKVKLLNNKWLVAYASNEEINKIVVLQFKDGNWLEVASYTLPENQKSINEAYFEKIVPKYVDDYIRQELLI